MKIALVASLAALGALLFALERLAPLRRARHSLFARLGVNLAFSALAFATFTLAVKPAAASLLVSADRFGIIPWLALPTAPSFVLGFLLMDLSFYYWHIANHKIPLLWRFHNVHHIDPDLDVSTALRFHFGELAMSAGFRIVQLGAIGVSPALYAAYEIAFQANTLFHHSNVRLPIGAERPLNVVLVTPRMHGIHHSQIRNETNSNFSVVLPWWDRLHRTLRLDVPQSEIVVGVPAYTLPGDNSLWAALAAPFRKQRDYWRTPDGALVVRSSAEARGDPAYLSE